MQRISVFIVLFIVLLSSLIIAQQPVAPGKEPTEQQMKELQNNLNAAKDPAKKIEILKEFAAQFPESSLKASAYNYILRLYINDLKAPEKAVAFAENILKTEKIEANKTAAYIFLFSRYLDKDINRAVTIAGKILDLDIRDSDLYNNIAYAIAEKGQPLELAEKLSKKSISLSTIENLKNHPRLRGAPEDYLKRILNENLSSYHDTLGWIYFKQGKNDEAILYLNKSLAKTEKDFLQLPFYPNTLFHLGSVYMKMEKHEKALPLLIRALMVRDEGEIRSALSQSYQKRFGSAEGLNDYIIKERSKIAKPAPDFTLKDLQGKELSLSSVKGKVVLLNFFAPTCGACVAEFPHLEALHKKYNKKGFSAVVVDVSNKTDATKKFAQENNATMHVLLDGQKVMEKYIIPGTPATYILSNKGKAFYRHIGYSPGDEKKIEKEIRELLGLH